MTTSAVRFIYFDLGNVLLNFSNEVACRQMGLVAGVAPERVRAAVFQSGLQAQFELGQMSNAEFYEEFCQRTDTRPSYEALRDAGSDIFVLNCPVIPIVVHLRDAGHRLGVLSNTCQPHWDHVRRVYKVIQEYFETYVLSFEVGAAKPAREIFERATKEVGVEPAEMFFVDDRPEHVAGARAYGWQAELYTTHIQLAADLRRRGLSFNY